MSIHLDPLVARKLEQFRTRRFRLLIVRSLCTGLLTFLVGMLLVALADWYWLLADSTRHVISGLAYLATILAVWWSGLRRLIRRPRREELAAQIELAEPALRENLLSAVELAAEDPTAIHDSPVFRSLLQGSVAQQMSRVRVAQLLPVQLIASWIVAAVLVAAVVFGLLTFGDTRFRQLAVRAVLPGANIARVSRIHVSVLEPTPHSLTMPEEETVAIVVDVTGGEVREVTLETSRAGTGTSRHTMRQLSESEYTANIHVADEAVEYRILAGDAVTQRYLIETRPRPRVVTFHKKYEYPEYTQLPHEEISETSGDLRALAGTNAELTLAIDQPVSVAELHIDPADSETSTVVPMTPVNDGTRSTNAQRWTARIPIEDAAVYKVRLVSEETGFENVFAPRYEIRPLPDQIPVAGFVDLAEPTLLLPPNDILSLKGMAEDELPVVRLEQHISVNGREWESVSLDTAPADDRGGRRVSAAWDWDLLGHELATGDQVVTKLVATDRKGNTGESLPLRIIVAAPEFDPERHAVMERKLELYDQLQEFAALLDDQKARALEEVERLRSSEQTAEEAERSHTILLDLATRQRERAGELLKAVQDVERSMPAGADAYDLDLTGRVIARIERDYSNVPASALTALRHADLDRRKAMLDELKRSFERATDDAVNVAKNYQVLMSHNMLAATAADLDALLQQQQQVVDSPTQTWERLLRQETLVISHLQDLEEMIRSQRNRLPQHLDDQMMRLLTWSESQRLRLQDAMESEEKLETLRKVSQDFLRQLAGKQRVDVIDGNLANRITGIRRDFHHRSGSLYVPIDQTGQAIRQENRLAAQATDAADSDEGRAILLQMELYAAEVDLHQRRNIEQLQVRRDLTQSREDADAQYAADAGLTYRAVSWLLTQHREVAPQESTLADNLLEVAPAYRTLEAGHELVAARDAVRALLNMERWQSQSFTSHIEHPRQWDLVTLAMELASERLKQAGVDRQLVDQLNQIRWSESVREAGRKIGERRSRRDAFVSAGHDLVELQEQLDAVVAAAEPVMADARAIIAKYAPTIPQLARHAAQDLRELESRTMTAADAVEQDSDSESAQDVAELRASQAAINEQIEHVLEALVEDANSQDLLDASQRERARDADVGIAAIQQPLRQVNTALDEAQQRETGSQQAKDLARAAEAQELTAQTLEQVAEHFEKLESGQDIAESRQELRSTESEPNLTQQMEQRIEQAEKLAELASQDQEQLLSELEEELKRNPAMQQALSEIAESTLQEARNALQYAARDDSELQRANERSDTAFQSKKKELAEDLRKMGAAVSRLSRELIQQADRAASQGKVEQAQQRLAAAQQELNAVADLANRAREDQLLAELADAAQQSRSALQSVAKALEEAQAATAEGRDAQLHADEKARRDAQNALERARKQFQGQQKRNAANRLKQSENVRRNADRNVQNARKRVEDAKREVQRARKQLAERPDDRGRQATLARSEARQADEERKLADAQRSQERAKLDVDSARQEQETANRSATTPLNAPNPAAQLAEQFSGEALDTARELQRRAEELAAASDFGDELMPSQQQIASANEKQAQVTEDVRQAADDVARAARHERRLENMAAATPLEASATEIQRVAQNESSTAERRLEAAADESQRNVESASNGQPQQNAKVLQAQRAIGDAERAIAAQAEDLTDLLERAAAEASEETPPGQGTDEADTGAPSQGEGNPSGDSPAVVDTAPSTPGTASASSAETDRASASRAAEELSAEELARGRQLARTLDELDRRLAAPSAESDSQSAPGTTPPPPLETVAQAARALRSAAATERVQAQTAFSEGTESIEAPSPTGGSSEYRVTTVNRIENSDWGKLRNKSVDDLTVGRSEAVSEDYRASIEAYFRVLAERAKKK